ncbi:hypothetical protein SynBIOSU31_03146 [Synechococcus sp. BIOS-U3-1]|nr:hypothetical protein SynBIOSU31_03146 [Synechococcus sp. BIOS-U3-1]
MNAGDAFEIKRRSEKRNPRSRHCILYFRTILRFIGLVE